MIIILANKEDSHLQSEIEILARVKRELRKNDIAKDICKEYGFNIDIIDGVPIEFEDDLGASAKTIDSCIKLDSGLLDEDFEVIMRYAIHELVHSLQHMKMIGVDPYDGEDYLNRGDELEAFQYQIEYEADAVGKEEAENYVDNLVEYHEVPPEKIEEKKKELLERT